MNTETANLWDKPLRFEHEEKMEFDEVLVNDEDDNKLFKIRIFGAKADLFDSKLNGIESEDPLFSLILDSAGTVTSDLNSSDNAVPYYNLSQSSNFAQIPMPPCTKYKTSSFIFSNHVPSPPTVKLYCISNYNWELHLFSPIDQVYKIYLFNLKADDDTDHCEISFKHQDGLVSKICRFKKKFFSRSSAKIKFFNKITLPTLQLLMCALTYFRYSAYGQGVTLKEKDPNFYDDSIYEKILENRKLEKSIAEREDE